MAELKLTIDANKALRDRVEVRTAERDAAVAHLRAVLDWSNTERFAGRTRHENDAPSSARSFLDGLDELQTSPKTSKDLDLCDECGCIGLCDPRCSLVPVQQDEPEGVCAFPNCSCTENRCPGVCAIGWCSRPSGHEPPCAITKAVAAIWPHAFTKPAEAGTQEDEPECDHVWRSSFGDTFCEKCNQDAPTGVRCRTCKGSGAWCDEGWVKPPQPCKACSGSGRVPAKRKAAPSVPEAAPLPRSRPPRSHRDDESLRRWEARHPSVGFPPAVPVQQEKERWAVRRAEIVERVGGEQAFADIVAEVARQHEEGEK